MRFLALLKRELQALFLSPIATVVFTVFLFFNGLLLSVILFNATQGVPMASSQIYGGWLGSGFTWIGMALYLPVITMRLMSEEKRQGSLELLLTTPISDLSVILSKWLGAFLFYYRRPLSANFNRLMIIVAALVVTATVITFFYKVSVHSLALWGMVGILFPLVKFSPALLWPTAIIIALAGLVISSRLILDAHTPRETLVGSIAGILVGYGGMTVLF